MTDDADKPTGFHITMPKQRSELRIQDDTVVIRSPRHRPNAWRRFWYWFLLGWQWRKIDD